MSGKTELETNYGKFRKRWTELAKSNWEENSKSPKFLESYARIASFNALRMDVLEPALSKESYLFIKEAHHDLLISHTSAITGSYRSALQSLRSSLENTMAGIYYSDHPIELRKWLDGKFRIAPVDVRKYFSEHPDLRGKPKQFFSEKVRTEYSALSKAVHASAKDVRMVDEMSKGLLWTSEAAKIGPFMTRERNTLQLMSVLICSLYANRLEGAKLPNVRSSLSSLLTHAIKNGLREEYGIVIG